jgi:hypothetical protein
VADIDVDVVRAELPPFHHGRRSPRLDVRPIPDARPQRVPDPRQVVRERCGGVCVAALVFLLVVRFERIEGGGIGLRNEGRGRGGRPRFVVGADLLMPAIVQDLDPKAGRCVSDAVVFGKELSVLEEPRNGQTRPAPVLLDPLAVIAVGFPGIGVVGIGLLLGEYLAVFVCCCAPVPLAAALIVPVPLAVAASLAGVAALAGVFGSFRRGIRGGGIIVSVAIAVAVSLFAASPGVKGRSHWIRGRRSGSVIGFVFGHQPSRVGSPSTLYGCHCIVSTEVVSYPV